MSQVESVGNIKAIGYYSHDDENGTQYDNLSQLRYLYERPSNNNNWRRRDDETIVDLNENFDTYELKDFLSHGCDKLLQWILKNLDKVKSPEQGRSLNPDFIGYRQVFGELLMTPYEKQEKWIICVARFEGNYYMTRLPSDEKKLKKEKNASNEISIRRCYWTSRFQQYMLSERPNTAPDLSQPATQSGYFCGVFESTIGKHKLLYAAKVDGVTSTKVLEESVDWTNIKFADLHTTFKRNPNVRYFHWWTRSCLVPVGRILCGYHEEGKVTQIESYRLDDLPRKFYQSPRECHKFLNQFLDLVKETIQRDYNECVYKFTFDPKNCDAHPRFKIISGKRIGIEEVANSSPDSECAFLRDWYVGQM